MISQLPYVDALQHTSQFVIVLIWIPVNEEHIQIFFPALGRQTTFLRHTVSTTPAS